MSTENQDTVVEEALVVETPSEETPAPEPKDWNNLFENAFETKEASETEVQDPAAPNPSVVETKTEAPVAEEVKVEEPEEDPKLDEIVKAGKNPFSFSRAELRAVEQDLLTPFRNPETDIKDVAEALEKFHPIRAQELYQHVVNTAATSFPNEWLEVITGIEGITVDKVKELHTRPETVRTEQPDNTTESYLTELYGDAWKDPKNDDELLKEDLVAAKAVRRAMELEEQVKNGNTEQQAKLDKALSDIEELRGIKKQFDEHQQAVFEKDKKEIFEASTGEFRSRVETSVFEKLFTDLNLKVTEQDTEDTKDAKEFVQALFKPTFGNEALFVDFISSDYSNREALLSGSQRVGKLMDEAAQREAKAKTSGQQEAQRLKAEAQSLRSQAQKEEAPLRVLTDAAAREFLQHPYARWAMKSLERIADLERKFARTGRKEIIGTTNTSTPDNWRDQLKDKEDKWDSKLIGERFAEAAR